MWAKGYTELLDLMAKHTQEHGNVQMDCYGTGEDLEAVSRCCWCPPPPPPVLLLCFVAAATRLPSCGCSGGL